MKGQVIEIFDQVVVSANPYTAVAKAIQFTGDRLIAGKSSFDLSGFENILVVGAGKGTAPMARAVEDAFGERIGGGIIIVKYSHTRPLHRIRQIEAAHPLPDSAGVRGTEEIMELLRNAGEKTLVICLLSGGGSALLVSPAEGIILEDKQVATDLLLRAGASIYELNAVRKHLSGIKGGRLARMASPGTLITLILSDVIGDRLDVIASGPTVPDSSTFNDAINVVNKYGIESKLPENVINHLKSGVEGKIADTPKEGEDCFRKTSTVIVGSLSQALQAARKAAERMGFDAEIITDRLQGDARGAAVYLADIAKRAKSSRKGGKPACLISGGETTVVVKGKGVGGRNQELALAFALEIEGVDGITMLSAGTDGTDGPTDATGAVVDGRTATLARKLKIRPESYLADNDSYSFFKEIDSLSGEKHHLVTGPTGTNVMDVQILLVET